MFLIDKQCLAKPDQKDQTNQYVLASYLLVRPARILYFGETFKVGRRRYYQFVEKGIKHGRREDLQGGGLIRPACHARPERISNRKKCETANENRGVRDRVCKARAGRSSGGDKAGLLGQKKEDKKNLIKVYSVAVILSAQHFNNPREYLKRSICPNAP